MAGVVAAPVDEVPPIAPVPPVDEVPPIVPAPPVGAECAGWETCAAGEVPDRLTIVSGSRGTDSDAFIGVPWEMYLMRCLNWCGCHPCSACF